MHASFVGRYWRGGVAGGLQLQLVYLLKGVVSSLTVMSLPMPESISKHTAFLNKYALSFFHRLLFGKFLFFHCFLGIFHHDLFVLGG